MTDGRPTSLFRIQQIPAVFAMALLGFSSFSLMLSALPVRAVQVGVPDALAGTITTVLLAVPLARWVAAELVPRTPTEDLPLRSIGRLLVPPVGLLFVATAVGGGVMTVLPLELADGPLVAAALVVFGLLTSLTRWRIGHLTDRRGHAGVPQVLVVIGVAGLMLLAYGLTGGPHWWAVFVGAALAGAAYGALQSVSLDLSFAHVSAGQAPLASATWNASFDAGGNIIVGWRTTIAYH